MYHVYVLQSLRTKKFYIGHTNNLERRIRQHNTKQSSFAKVHAPFTLVFSIYFSTKSEAYREELRIKRMKSGEGLRKLLNSQQAMNNVSS